MSRYPSCAVITNVFGNCTEDYIAVLDRLNRVNGIAAYELNVSCPNVHEGGMIFGSDPRLLGKLGPKAKIRANRPLIVKLRRMSGPSRRWRRWRKVRGRTRYRW